MDSTAKIVNLWRLCVDSQGEGKDPDLLRWSTLRSTLETLPIDQCESLRCKSVDDILRQYFGSGRKPVNFTRFWRGMEVILQISGTFHCNGMDNATQQKVASLRRFRDSVLERSALEVRSPQHDGFTKRELHSLYDLLRRQAAAEGCMGAPVCDFWVCRLRELQNVDESVSVTADHVASALLQWLELLMKPLMGGSVGSADAAESESESESEDDDASYSDEPERERTPPQLAARTHAVPAQSSPAAHAARASQGGGQQSGPQGGQQGATAPEARRGPAGGAPRWSASSSRISGASPAAAPAAAPTAAPQGRPSPSSWLLPPSPDEPREVQRFRDQLVRRVGGGGPELVFSQLYRGMLDVLSEDAAMRGGGPKLGSAALRAAVQRLSGVVRRQVRMAFRQMDCVLAVQALPRSSSELERPGGEGKIFAELIRGQADTAVILERRKDAIPRAFRLAAILERARRRALQDATTRLRRPCAGSPGTRR